MKKTQRTLDNAMTVQQLIDQLKTFEPNNKVVFSYNYGDYVRTVAASPTLETEERDLYYSENIRSLALADYDDDLYDDDELVQAVVIS